MTHKTPQFPGRLAYGMFLALCLLAASPARAADAAKGKYLAILGDCTGCHTASRQQPFTGGLAFHAAFGTVFSTNITPDPETGIGKWSADDFYRALHEGLAPGGRHLYPALPYIYFQRISRAESDDLFAYLHTLKPVRRPPTPNKLMFPFNLRFGLYFWNLLYLHRPPPPANASPAWKRGEYIVNGLGHCASCHTPKNFMFGDDPDRPLAGGTVDYWYAPNITGHGADGLTNWSHEELVDFLTTGHNRHATVAGSMREKIVSSTSKMTPDDVSAIATYLKSVAYKEPPPVSTPRAEALARGQAIYAAHCQTCHGDTPARATHGTPWLGFNTVVVSHDPTTVIRMILTGDTMPALPGAPPAKRMPGFSALDDGQIADVATYIRNAWSNHAPPASATQVHTLRRTLATLDQ